MQNQALSSQDIINKLTVDDQTSEPYYRQLKRHLELLITKGEIVQGYGLPSERDLAQALNLSRTTVKRCYDELRQQGLLTVHGRGGTVVSKPPLIRPPLGKLKGFTEEMEALGLTPTTRLESHDILADRTIASIFQRPSNAQFLRLVRIRLADGAPMTREVAWYDLTLAPKLAHWDTAGSIYAYLRDECAIALSWAEQSIEAIACSAAESQVFDLPVNSPCLLLKRRSYNTNEQLVEYVEGTFRGDAYTYRVKLDINH